VRDCCPVRVHCPYASTVHMRVHCPVLCLCTALPVPAQGGLTYFGIVKHAETLEKFLPLVADSGANSGADFAAFAAAIASFTFVLQYTILLGLAYLHIWCALCHLTSDLGSIAPTCSIAHAGESSCLAAREGGGNTATGPRHRAQPATTSSEGETSAGRAERLYGNWFGPRWPTRTMALCPLITAWRCEIRGVK